MHFQVNRDEYYNKLIGDLKARVPEFETIFDEDDSVYPIMGDFSCFLLDNINNNRILKKCFYFINNAIKVGGTDTEDVIVIQVFQPIYDDNKATSKAEEFLTGKALEVFHKYKTKYLNT